MGGMEPNELRDLLIRIDERVQNIQDDIRSINRQRNCLTNSEKIKTLERMVWGTASAVLLLCARVAYETFK